MRSLNDLTRDVRTALGALNRQKPGELLAEIENGLNQGMQRGGELDPDTEKNLASLLLMAWYLRRMLGRPYL